jgi:hypothetical protein
MGIQICSMCIQNTPGATSTSILCSYWLIQRKGGSYWLIPSLAISLRHQVLLYAHSKCVGVAFCAFKIWQELLYLYHEGEKLKI